MSKKLKKFARFVKKMLKFVGLKNLENHSITFRNYTVTYFQILDEVSRLLRLKKPKNRKKNQKT